MMELYIYIRTLEWVNRNTEFASIFATIAHFCPSVSILQYQQPFLYITKTTVHNSKEHGFLKSRKTIL